MNRSYSQAIDLVNDGHYAEAKPILLEICGIGAAARPTWTMLGLCFLAEGNMSDLFGLVELRHRQAGDGLELFNECLTTAIHWTDHRPLHRVIEKVPADSAMTVITRYLSAILTSQGGDADKAVAELHQAAQRATRLPANLASAPYIATIVQEANMLERFATIAEIEKIDRGTLVTRLGTLQATADFPNFPSTPIDADFVFLSSCDERYLDRFGDSVVRALDAAGLRTIYHLHIVDPSPNLDAKIERLQACCESITLRYSTETYRDHAQGYARASYYACARLVRLPEIFARYERDVFMWDMDTQRAKNLSALATAMQGSDLGYFQIKNTRLTLVCHLAVAYFANTPSSHRCAALIGNYILTKLPRTAWWLLDQSSVYCASRFLSGQGALQITDFTVTPGGELADYVEGASTASEKQSMRKLAGSSAR